MKISINTCFVLALTLCSAFCFPNKTMASLAPSETINDINSDQYQGASDLNLKLVNKLRSSLGLHKLRKSAILEQAAKIRVRELAEYYSHTRPNGTEPFTAVTELGYYYSVGAENIASASGYPAETIGKTLFDSWKESPRHYDNMTNSEIKEAGIAIYFENGTWYGVQLFALPTNSNSNYGAEANTNNNPQSNNSSNSNSQTASVDSDYLIDQTLMLINDLRRNANLKTLRRDPLLERAALTRARELAGYWNDNRPDGREFHTVISDIGYNYSSVSMINSYGMHIDNDVAKQFFESFKSQQNNYSTMVDDTFEDIGIAFYKLNDTWYIVQLFASKLQ